MAVVDDLVADIDRRAVFLQGTLDDFYRPLDAGTKTAGLGEDDANHGHTSPNGGAAPGWPAYGMPHRRGQCRGSAPNPTRGFAPGPQQRRSLCNPSVWFAQR